MVKGQSRGLAEPLPTGNRLSGEGEGDGKLLDFLQSSSPSDIFKQERIAVKSECIKAGLHWCLVCKRWAAGETHADGRLHCESLSSNQGMSALLDSCPSL